MTFALRCWERSPPPHIPNSGEFTAGAPEPGGAAVLPQAASGADPNCRSASGKRAVLANNSEPYGMPELVSCVCHSSKFWSFLQSYKQCGVNATFCDRVFGGSDQCLSVCAVYRQQKWFMSGWSTIKAPGIIRVAGEFPFTFDSVRGPFGTASRDSSGWQQATEWLLEHGCFQSRWRPFQQKIVSQSFQGYHSISHLRRSGDHSNTLGYWGFTACSLNDVNLNTGARKKYLIS